VLLASPGGSPGQEQPAPPAAADTAGPPPVNIFVDKPADLADAWKFFARPDFVILSGEEFRRLSARPKNAGTDARMGFTVDSVTVKGVAAGDSAELTVEVGVTLSAEGPVWVPFRIDARTLTTARENGEAIPLRSVEGTGWEAELKGRGRHVVRVGLLVPVRLTPEGKTIQLAVPEAPSTRLDITFPGQVSTATVGPGEAVAVSPVVKDGRTRIEAELTPRSSLTLSWRDRQEGEGNRPPLLVSQGEIAVDVDAPGSLRTQSSWLIRSARGEAESLELGLHPDETVLELALDGQPPPAGFERVNGATRLTIPLTTPLAPGQARRLTLTTRRSAPAAGATKVVLSGFPLANAMEQTGSVGVSRAGNLWVTGTVGRGIVQIDPRTELPAALRARPATELAYRFTEQPFELTLGADPAPPVVRAGVRTTIAVSAASALVDTTLSVETTRGRLFDMAVGLPPGLGVESVGPPDLVAGWRVGPLPAQATPAGVAQGVMIHLASRVAEGGRFRLHLVGRQAIDPSAGEVSIGLFSPADAVSDGGRIAVLTESGMTAQLNEAGGKGVAATAFRPSPTPPPGDWEWPASASPASPPALWLRYDDAPQTLPLRIARHPMTLSQSTTLRVQVERREAVVKQEVECGVQFGTLDHLDVIVPPSIDGRWEVEGAWATRRADLGRTPRGERVVRLTLASELTLSARYSFRFRIPLNAGSSPGSPAALKIPWLGVEGAQRRGGPLALVSTGPGLVLEPGGDWRPAPESVGEGDSAALRLVGPVEPEASPSLELNVTERALAALPNPVVSRLVLTTVQGPEGDLRTTAAYRVEANGGALSVALPPGAELQTVRVDGRTVRQVEELPGAEGLRVGLPSGSATTPVLVEMEYRSPSRTVRSRGAWAPPRLLERGIVQETLWEVSLPWNRAVVGVPPGWSDENQWHLETYVWKRRPRKSPAELAAWVGLPEPGPRPAGGAGLGAGSLADYHSYLFGMPGNPDPLAVSVADRAWLVAVCSGGVLAVGGVLLLLWRPPIRVVGIAAALLVLSAATTLHPTVSFLAIQSAAVGVVLTALLALMQRWSKPRRPGRPSFEPESGARGLVSPPGSGWTTGAGSDDSTAIRQRTTSTMDFVHTSIQLEPDGSGSSGSLPPRTGLGDASP
jgi:hypothetical protein